MSQDEHQFLEQSEDEDVEEESLLCRPDLRRCSIRNKAGSLGKARWPWGRSAAAIAAVSGLVLATAGAITVGCRWYSWDPLLPHQPRFRAAPLSHRSSSGIAEFADCGLASCSPIGPLGDADMQDAAVENLMKLGQLHASERSDVHASVVQGFRNMSSELERNDPEVAREVRELRLSDSQKAAILSMLRLLQEPKVQELGQHVAKAAEKAHKDRARQEVEDWLKLQLANISRLRDQLVPSSTQELWKKDHDWVLTHTLDSMQWVAPVLAPAPMRSSNLLRPSTDVKELAVHAGVLEEGKILLAAVRACAHVKQPVQGATRALSMRSASEISCSGSSGDKGMMLKLLCPLKFGAQGVDAIRAVVALVERDRQKRTQSRQKETKLSSNVDKLPDGAFASPENQGIIPDGFR